MATAPTDLPLPPQVNGSLGQTIVSTLQTANFPLTLLTTNPSKTSTTFPNIPSLETDYTSPTTLTATLTSLPTSPSQTALIIFLSRHHPDPQITLLDGAAAAVGIANVIPSSFGAGKPEIEYLRTFPPLVEKYKMEAHVAALGGQGKLSYTCIQTAAFLDWALDRGFYANLIGAEAHCAGKGATMVFDCGDAKFSATMLGDICKAVVAVLRNPDEFRNQQVYIHSAVLSQNQLLWYARELVPEREFPVVDLDTAQLEQTAWAKYHAGDRSHEVMRMFLPRATFGKGLGLFEQVDNDRLGIKTYGEEDVKALVARYLER